MRETGRHGINCTVKAGQRGLRRSNSTQFVQSRWYCVRSTAKVDAQNENKWEMRIVSQAEAHRPLHLSRAPSDSSNIFYYSVYMRHSSFLWPLLLTRFLDTVSSLSLI